VQDLLHEALELEPERREVLLTQIAAGDDALAREVRSLLAALGSGLLGEPDDAPKLFGLATDRIGPYRILRPLGRGGMGAVYLAERATGDVTQVVALKLLRTDYAVPQLVARFAAERRILARLEHPGIARLIDAGATDDGQPYFAMEFVEGADLITWARSRRLGIADRLSLLLAVCDAVDYAHRQLVVHRDLKPSNILVGEDGRPRLLDFGIAKLMEPDQPRTVTTRTLTWLTPDYASPEQARGEAVGTATDVYSLGVLLYELLAGTRPFDLERLSPAAMEHIICHQAPRRPSERVGERRLRRLLRGDLDTITMKALAKEPERRYASVREFAEDIRRHLDREPVRARPDTVAYRAASFARRHRTAVAAAGIVLAALIGGLAAVSWQAALAARARDRAQAALQASQEVSQFLVGMFQSSDPAEQAGDTAVARAIVRRGVARAEALDGQPVLQARLLDALGMVYIGLGQYDTAWVLIRRGLEQRRANLAPSHPDVIESLLHLGRVERARSRYPESETAYLEALRIQQAGNDTDPAVLIQTLDQLGYLMPYLGNEDQAERYYQEALDLAERSFPDDGNLIADRITLLAAIAERRGEYPRAVGLMREALVRRRSARGPDAPETATTMIQLADAVRDLDDPGDEPEQLYRQALVIQRRTLGASNLRLVHGMNNLATLLSTKGRHAEAERLLRQVLDLRRHALGDHPSTAESMDALARELGREGRFEDAIALHREGLALWRRLLGPGHAAVAGSMASLAVLYSDAGRQAEAEPMLREALAMRARIHGPGHVLIGVLLSDLGLILTRENKLTEAETTLTRAITILRAHQRPTHFDVRTAHGRLADVYARLGRPAEAARHRALAAAAT